MVEQAYDPCYHLACDTFANNNNYALDVNSDAVAFSTLQFAMNTSNINAVSGKGNFPPLDGGGAGAGTGTGGGLHFDEHAPETE